MNLVSQRLCGREVSKRFGGAFSLRFLWSKSESDLYDSPELFQTRFAQLDISNKEMWLLFFSNNGLFPFIYG